MTYAVSLLIINIIFIFWPFSFQYELILYVFCDPSVNATHFLKISCTYTISFTLLLKYTQCPNLNITSSLSEHRWSAYNIVYKTFSVSTFQIWYYYNNHLLLQWYIIHILYEHISIIVLVLFLLLAAIMIWTKNYLGMGRFWW